MSKSATSSGTKGCFHITYKDQQKINKFARHNAKLDDLKRS
jgi:hypothetical protein